MTKSTATFIPYDLRPAKQTERRILLDYLASAKEGGLAIIDSRYVGMGGVKFYDFILMHRFVGINRMESLERDQTLIDRCEFNRPYHFIKVHSMSCRDFISSDEYQGNTIFWLDYDKPLSDEIIDDVQALGAKMRVGSFVFITIAASVPKDLYEKTERQRLEEMRDQFGPYANSLTPESMEESNYPSAMHDVLLVALVNSFAARTDGVFFPNFRISYRDSIRMLTIGGFFAEQEPGERAQATIFTSLPFLDCGDEPFRIRNFNLSERERQLMEFAATKSRKNSKEANQLRKLGIKNSEIQAYEDLLRFLPRYIEAIN